jgi:hypothetical protein
MRRYLALAAAVAIPMLLMARPATPAGQVQPRPGAGTGVVTVTGTVNLGDAPPLHTLQSGDWKVAVTNAPPAVRAPLGIVRVRGSYEVRWTTSERDVIRIEEIGPGGWVRGTVGERAVWLNLDAARSVTETR